MLDTILTTNHYNDYSAMIQQFELLTVAEEQAIALAMFAAKQDGAPASVVAVAAQARERLILHNLRLVPYVARKYLKEGIDIMDLVQDGNIGLMMAVDRYKPGRQRFVTYAYPWIKQGVRRSSAMNIDMIQLPIKVRLSSHQVYKAWESLGLELDREPTVDEVVGRSKARKSHVRVLMERRRTLSLDWRTTDGETFDLFDKIIDPRTSSLEEQAVIRVWVETLLSSLRMRYRVIINKRFGLGNENPHTFSEVALCLNTKKQRVEQLEREALDKLRLYATRHPPPKHRRPAAKLV